MGLIEVVPGGPLSRAGFRAGDIPGSAAFCAALDGAEEGFGNVDVANVADWDSDGPNRRRELAVPKADSHK
jgi:hypothetical protein